MFADDEHKFAVHEHKFADGEHKFAVHEYKIFNCIAKFCLKRNDRSDGMQIRQNGRTSPAGRVLRPSHSLELFGKGCNSEGQAQAEDDDAARRRVGATER